MWIKSPAAFPVCGKTHNIYEKCFELYTIYGIVILGLFKYRTNLPVCKGMRLYICLIYEVSR